MNTKRTTRRQQHFGFRLNLGQHTY